MKNGTGEAQNEAERAEEAITRITVAGFKAIRDEQSIEIRPLTILAGANSSGKSSMMQPLLLLKQTLEAPYDPGALFLNGPLLRFTSTDQLLSHTGKSEAVPKFCIGIQIEPGAIDLSTSFGFPSSAPIEVESMVYRGPGEGLTLRWGMSHKDILSELSQLGEFPTLVETVLRGGGLASVIRSRCFLALSWAYYTEEAKQHTATALRWVTLPSPSDAVANCIREMIYVPGLRGNAERLYPLAAVGPTFPGRFDDYLASVIATWQTDKHSVKLAQLRNDLIRLGLNWTVVAERVNDAQLRLLVGRVTRQGRTTDLVDIADVGLGVSQALPMLVALLAAQPGQLVYVEQPEIHLHPRAQSAMAQVVANAANRGVRVVVETHSSLLLYGILTLVAQGNVQPEKVKLHWFEQRKNGTTKISSADPDDAGAFGEWPEDFANVELEAESRYLDAAELRRLKG